MTAFLNKLLAALLNKLHRRDTEVALAPQPVELNPDQSRQLSRAMARFERVKAAIRKGDKRPELKRERDKLEYLIEVLRK
jgi:hypothetical protein